MLRQQQDRDDLPRYLEALDTSEHGSAIANKTGALDRVRNDVALIATKNGPVVIAGFTWANEDQRWTGDNEAQKTLGKLAEAMCLPLVAGRVGCDRLSLGESAGRAQAVEPDCGHNKTPS